MIESWRGKINRWKPPFEDEWWLFDRQNVSFFQMGILGEEGKGKERKREREKERERVKEWKNERVKGEGYKNLKKWYENRK